jgi:hypothetical protein
MKKRIGKINRVLKGLLLTGLFLVMVQPVGAAWPTENVMGMDLGNILNSVEQKTQSIILARMQQEAIKQIQSTMGDLIVGGNGHKSYVITNYEDFIYGTSRRAGEQMMTDFFKTLKEGVTPGEADTLRAVETELKEELFGGPPKQTIGSFVEGETGVKAVNPYAEVFAGKNLDAFYEWKAGDFNDAKVIKDKTKAMVLNYMNMVRDVQRTKAIANQGFDPQNGIPGSVISQLVAKSEAAPIEMISNATSVEQVVTSLATSTLTSFMRTGYGNVSLPALNQIDKINQKYEGGVSLIQSMIYEGQN